MKIDLTLLRSIRIEKVMSEDNDRIISSLFGRMKKLNPRQRCVVYKSLELPCRAQQFVEMDKDKALVEFFEHYRSLIKDFSADAPSILYSLEKAITDAADEKVLEPCIEELKKAVESLSEEERRALGYDNFDWQKYQGQFWDLESLQKRAKDLLELIPADLEDYKARKDFKHKGITPFTIIKRMERLQPHWRAYIYGRVGKKKLADMSPETALCKFAASYGEEEGKIEEAGDEIDSDVIEIFTLIDSLITKVEMSTGVKTTLTTKSMLKKFTLNNSHQTRKKITTSCPVPNPQAEAEDLQLCEEYFFI